MTQAPARSTRMELLLTSAMRVVAEHGLRGLTHRAVDRAAGLPEGSCSAYLRTREALVLGLTGYVSEGCAGQVRDLAAELSEVPVNDNRAVEIVARALLRWVDERNLLVARLELTLQASRDAELAAVLGVHHRVLVDVVSELLTDRAKPHGAAAAETLVASFDGVMIGALGRPVAQRKAFVRRSVEALMAGLG
ncbi:MAG: TetR family transcriptional regulator [Nocardioides sp.]|nr:TetR family transcriptional regulator [Nocardioides sp.]